MGRVDEAMRRAGGSGVTGSPETTPLETTFAAVVAKNAETAREAEAARAAHETFDEGDEDPIEATTPPNGLPDLATPTSLFERIDHRLAKKVVVDQDMLSVSREQYRRLAASLHHGEAANGLKVIMISSAVASEGKTLTASNLALTLSESYHRNVLLIDADLRRPSLHTVFGIPGSPGLSEGLMSIDEPTLAVHQVSPRLTILPAGTPSSDPMAGLTSRRMRRLILEARAAFSWVIIDTPPVGLLTDANLLAGMVDGTVLVVKAGVTPFDLVKRAVEAIGPNRILGVVLNRAAAGSTQYGYTYGYGNYATKGALMEAAGKPVR